MGRLDGRVAIITGGAGGIGAAAGRTQAEVDAEAATTCLMRRWAAPREIAYPILWLASDVASYVTGAALMADGGRLVV